VNIWHLFSYDAVVLVATPAVQLSGGMNVPGWGIVFVYLFFAAGLNQHKLYL